MYVDGSGHMKLAGILVWDMCVIYLFAEYKMEGL